jgi:DNA repair protein RadA
MGEETKDSRDYYRAKYQGVEDLPGVGPAIASKLATAGWKTVQAIATATEMELIDAGLGEDTAKKVIRAARKSLEIKFMRGDELEKLHKDKTKMTTGCSNLDRLLEGGLDTKSITEFYGEFGTGKSQICQQLAVTVQLPVEKGGLDGACLYIDTESVFLPERVSEMALYLGLEPKDVLKKIVYAEAFTSEHQAVLIDNCDDVIKDNGVRLIVVDSLMAHFRSEYPGREVLAPRQQNVNRFLHKIKRLAQAFNAAAVVTNQVVAHPDSYGGPQHPKPVGGHVVGHAVHTRVFIRKGRENLRIAKIVASPFLPEGETPFRITGGGIVGDEEY